MNVASRLGLIVLVILLWSESPFAGQKVFFYHTDPAGTPLVMTDEKTNVVWRAEYKPFGEEFEVTPDPENTRMFVGKEMDKETGLYYFGARYMEPIIGRFVSPDPVGAVDPGTGNVNERKILNPQRLNYYAYGLNNPHRYIDPDGNQEINIDRPIFIPGLPNYDFGDRLRGPGGIVADTPNNEITQRVNDATKLAEKIARGHAYDKHVIKKGEFPEIKNKQQFTDHIRDILSSPSEEKQLDRGRVGYWHKESGTVVIKDPNNPEGGTAFRPREGKKYFDKLK